MPKDRIDLALEAFVDEGINQAEVRGYKPRVFISMRAEHGTVDAIERLVRSGDVQSGFIRLQELNILKWSIESAVRQFPSRFTPEARACAELRLNNIDDKTLRVR